MIAMTPDHIISIWISIMATLVFVLIFRLIKPIKGRPDNRMQIHKAIITTVVRATPQQLNQALWTMEQVWMGHWHPLRGRSHLRTSGWSERLVEAFIPVHMSIKTIDDLNDQLAERGKAIRALEQGGLIMVDRDGKLIS